MANRSSISYAWLLAGACWVACHAAAGQQAPVKRAATRAKLPAGRHYTLFPDTLRAQLLEVTYWSTRQVDSIQASLGTTRREVKEMVADSTARYRVFHSQDDYPALLLFYRPVATPNRWIEFDLNPWLAEYGELPYLRAYVVQLDQQGPEEIMVKMGGGSYGTGYRTMVDYTLLLSIDGAPRLLWQSLDGRQEEVVPSLPAQGEEMTGGNYASKERIVAMRKGLVYVSTVHREGEFQDAAPRLTPIAPGYYQYEAGHFRRAALSQKPRK